MKKILNSIKNMFKGIIWPTPKEVIKDTWFTVLSAAVLSCVIWIWVTGIDLIINFIISIL